MAVSPFKTFSAGEILFASDLNSSYLQVFNNGEDLGFPRTKAAAMAGQKLTLDNDGDTSLRAASDDVVVLELQGADLYQVDGSVASPVNGLNFVASATGVATRIDAQGTDTNVNLEINGKGTGRVRIDGILVANSLRELQMLLVSVRTLEARMTSRRSEALADAAMSF